MFSNRVIGFEFALLPKIGNFGIKQHIMGKNTSVSLGSYYDKFVESKLNEGRFKNASEVIRAGLRLLEEDENRVAVLRSEIKKGIESGIMEDFNPAEFLIKIKNEYGA